MKNQIFLSFVFMGLLTLSTSWAQAPGSSLVKTVVITYFPLCQKELGKSEKIVASDLEIEMRYQGFVVIKRTDSNQKKKEKWVSTQCVELIETAGDIIYDHHKIERVTTVPPASLFQPPK